MARSPLSATLAGLALSVSCATLGCAGQRSPLMKSVMLLDTTAPPDSALLVVMRDSNPCDGGDPFRVVDDGGRFLGELTPHSKFAIRLPAGHHALFAWQPFGDLPTDLYPNANQVGALEGDFEAGKTYTAEVSVNNPTHAVRKTCFGYLFLSIHFVDPSSPTVSEELSNAEPFTPDFVAGTAAVEKDRANVSAHIAMGMRKLSH
jgi:hypothetical protein